MKGKIESRSPFPNWIIESKIKPEEQLVTIFHRDRLIQQLNIGLSKKLTLVTAPAGYGKSVLLESWSQVLSDQGIGVAWLTLDGDDNRPDTLALYLAFSLFEAGLKIESDELTAGKTNTVIDPKKIVGMLSAAITASNERYALILDGFEHLTREDARSVVKAILKYFPSNIHIVIAGRTRNDLPISDLRLHGAIMELKSEDLKFTYFEMMSFLSPHLEKSQFNQVAEKSKGWPVALQFLKIALATNDDPNSVLRKFRGTRKDLNDYFSEHFLNFAPEAHKTFLLEASILDEIDAESADYILERSDSRLLLEDMHELDAFLMPDENHQDTYHLHPLLREFLHRHLKVHYPDRYKVLHQRAAKLISEKGNVLRAMKYALKIGDQEMAADIIEAAGGLTNWDREGMSRLRAADALLPEDIIVSRPRIHLIRALILLKDGRLTDARQIIQHIKSLHVDSKDDLLNYEIAVVASTINFYEGSDPAEHSAQLKSTLRFSDHKYDVKTAFFYTTLCVSGLQYGHFRQAIHAANKGLATRLPFSMAYFHLHLGAIGFAQGRLQEANVEYGKAKRIMRKGFSDDKDMKLVVNVLTAEWHYERNEISTAKNLLGDTNTRLEHGEAWYEIYAAGYTTSSAIVYELEGLEACQRETDGAIKYIQKEGLRRLRRVVVASSCGYLTRSGEIRQARKLVQENGLSLEEYKLPKEKEENALIRERLSIIPPLCRLLIAEKRYKRAIHELSHFIEIEQMIGHERAVLKYSLLLALALFHTKKRRASFDLLTEVLTWVRKEGFIRLVLDEANFIDHFLKSYVKSRNATERDHAAYLLNILDEGNAKPEVTRLSRREHQVLEELSKGLSDKVIARHLDVSENTVRFHLKNIFKKLGVNSRLQAVTEASNKSHQISPAKALNR